VGPTDHSAGLRGGVGSTFSREQCIRPTLLTTHERLPRTGPPVGSVRWAYGDWRGKHTCRVGQVFPCRVYIDSNHRNSRI
jgi:hypothetical protein